MLAIDLHSHILPGVDDGPATLEGSFAMARAAVTAGTGQIVATPHVNKRSFIEPEAIRPAVAALNRALEARGIGLVVRSGAEIALLRLLDLGDEQLECMTLGGGPYLLLESPFRPLAGDIGTLIFGVQTRGFRVLLAHPERCPVFHRDPDALARLVDAGVLLQVTETAITGAFGDRVRQFALRLLREDLVHVIASDAHDHEHRPPGIGEAVRRAERSVPGIDARAHWLVHDVPAAILDGAPIPEAPRLSAPRAGSWRRRLARPASSRR